MEKIIKHRVMSAAVLAVAVIFLYGCRKSEESEEIKDVEGNVYHTVVIGDQVWMKENLRTSSFRDGSWMLTQLYADYEWAGAGAACCIYHPNYVDGLDSEEDICDAYGCLYNWYAVTDSRGLCPVGFRVPTEDDWDELAAFLGGDGVAGGKIKSKRTDPDAHPRWDAPNTDASNSSAFNGLPSGYRTSYGAYEGIGYYACWWSSDSYDATYAYSVYVSCNSGVLEGYNERKRAGYSVRCIKE